MDLHRPKRLLGLFSKRYSSQCTTPTPCATQQQQQVDEDVYSKGDSEMSTSIYSVDEVSLLRLTEQKDILVKELHITKENLEKEKKLTHDLNQRLIMKAISIDCQLADTEERFKKSKAKIDVSNKRNKELSEKLRVVQIENQTLMKRTAALARRDQIQKATILTSNAEILKLMSTIEAFQERFLTLADAVAIVQDSNMAELADAVAIVQPEKEQSSAHKSSDNDDESQITMPLSESCSEDSVTPFEEDQMTPSEQEDRKEVKRSKENKIKLVEYDAKQEEFKRKQEEFKAKEKEFTTKQEEHQAKQEEWSDERIDLFRCISKLKSNNGEIKKKFVQTLKKHQWKWHKEKEKLLKKVGDLEVWLEEKEADLMLTKNALANAIARGRYGPNKGRDLKQADTFGTLTTQEESLSESLSACSSSSSLTLAYSLTETSNNLSVKLRNEQALDILDTFDDESYSYSVHSHCDDTPPRGNGMKTN